MKYSGWNKMEMIGELVLRGVIFTKETARAMSWKDLETKLLQTELKGYDPDESDSETGRFG